MRLIAPPRLALLLAAAVLLACGPRSTPHVDAGTDADVPDDVGPDDADVVPDAPADGDVDGDVEADSDSEYVDGGADSCGQETWLRSYDLESSDRWAGVEHFVVAGNGDILAAGSTHERAWTARFTTSGAVEWNRWLGIGEDHVQSTARAITETESGEIVLVSTPYDLMAEERILAMTRLREDGELVSSLALAGELDSVPRTVMSLDDGEPLVVATEVFHEGVMLVVHDVSSETVRRITFEPRLYRVGGLVPRSDGTLWLAATAGNPSASVGEIGVLLLLSADGDVLASYYVDDGSFWRITAAGAFGEDGAMLVGEEAREHSTNIWVHALDADAEPVWSMDLGNPGDGAPSNSCWPWCTDEHGLDVARLAGDRYVVVGTERSTLGPDEGYHHGWMVWLYGWGEEIRQVHLGERGTPNFVQAVAPTPTGMVVGGRLDDDLFVASLGPAGLLDGDCSVFQMTDLLIRPHDLPVLTEFDITATVEVADVRPVNVEHFEEPFRSACLCPQ